MKCPKLLVFVSVFLFLSYSTKVHSQNHVLSSTAAELTLCEDDTILLSAESYNDLPYHVFYRISGSVTPTSSTTTVVQFGLLNTLTVTPDDYENGDRFYVEIFEPVVLATSTLDTSTLVLRDASAQITLFKQLIPDGTPPLLGGTIQEEDQIICQGDIPNTLSVIDASTGSDFIFAWEQSIDGGETFTNIPQESQDILVLPSLNQTTLFRRATRLAIGGSCVEYTNVHQVNVLEHNPGQISSDDSAVCFNNPPPVLRNLMVAQVGTGTLSYDWEVSLDGVNWLSTGVNSITYQATNTLEETRHYRRKSILTTVDLICEKYSNSIEISVLGAENVGEILGDQVICNGDLPDPLNYNVPFDDDFVYQWERSTDGTNFSPIVGQNFPTLTFTENASFYPSTTSFYRMAVIQIVDGVNCFTPSNAVSIRVLPENIDLTASTPSLCLGEEVSFTASGNAAFTFYVDGVAQNNTNTRTLILPNLTQSSTITLEAIEQGCTVFLEAFVEVTAVAPGEIMGNPIDCSSGSAPYEFTNVEGASIDQIDISLIPTAQYQWQTSFDGINWSNVINEIQKDFTLPETASLPIHVRRIVLDNNNPTECNRSSNVIFLPPFPNLQGGTISPTLQVLCNQDPIPPITVEGASEGASIIYQWEVAIGSSINFTPIEAAVDETYTPDALVQNQRFRRKVIDTNFPNCFAYSSEKIIQYNEVYPGELASVDEFTLLPGEPFPTLGDVNSISANATGFLTYQWQSSLDGITWEDILSGGNAVHYTPTSFIPTTHFRRIAISTFGGEICEAISNEITLFTRDYLLAGSINSPQLICDELSPMPLELVGVDSGETISYQWEYALEGSSVFLPLSETSTRLILIRGEEGYPNVPTQYRVSVSSSEASLIATQTQPILIDVDQTESTFTYLGEGEVFCNGDTLAFAATGVGSYSYYLNNILIEGPTTDTSFSLTEVLQNASITMVNHLPSGCENTVTIPLQIKTVFAGEITGKQTICAGITPIPLRSSHDGLINGVAPGAEAIYEWQSSTDGVNFSPILLANEEEYVLQELTQSTYFKRILYTITDGKRCEDVSNTVLVTLANQINQPSPIVINTSLCVGAAEFNYSGGTSPYISRLYDINNNLVFSGSSAEKQIFTDLIPGVHYRLEVQDSSCFQPQIESFQVPFSLNLDLSRVEITDDLCTEVPINQPNGSIRLASNALTGGSNQFDYRWTGPNGFVGQGLFINNLYPGQYHLTAIDRVLGCETQATLIVEETPPIIITVSSEIQFNSSGEIALSCAADATNFIEIVASGGSGNYHYAWEKDEESLTGETTNRIENVTLGEYRVVVTSVPANGNDPNELCQATLEFTVVAPEPLIASFVPEPGTPTDCNTNTINFGLRIEGGISPYEISVNSGVYRASTSNNIYFFEGINPASLGLEGIIEVRDQNDCTITPIRFPIASSRQFNFSATSNNINCNLDQQGSIDIIATPSILEGEVLLVEWRSDTLHFFDTWANGQGRLDNIVNPGTYTVTVSSQEGCVSYVGEFDIEDFSQESLSVEITNEVPSTSCNEENGRIDLMLSGGYPPYQIQWERQSLDQSWESLPQFNNQAIVNGLEGGIYRAHIADSSRASNTESCQSTVTTRAIELTNQVFLIEDFLVIEDVTDCGSTKLAQIQFKPLINGLTATTSQVLSLGYSIDGDLLQTTTSTFQFEEGTGLVTIYNLIAGEHQLNIVSELEGAKCDLQIDFMVQENGLDPILYTGPQLIDLGYCDATVNIEIQKSDLSGGTPYEGEEPYDLEWLYTPIEESSQVTQVFFGRQINQAAPGNYQLVIRDANGCSNDTLSNPIIITVTTPEAEPFLIEGILVDPDNPDEFIKAIPLNCTEQGGGEIGVNIRGGLRPFEVNWYKLTPSQSTTDSLTSNAKEALPQFKNQTYLQNLDSGTYQIEINALNESCTGQGSIYTTYVENITVLPNAELYIVSGPFIDSDLCSNLPGRVSIEIFDNNQSELFFYYNGELVQEESNPQQNEQTHTLLIDNPTENGNLKIINAQGCELTTSLNLSLGEPNFSFNSQSFEASGVLLARETIEFENTSTNPYVRSEWIFGDFTAAVEVPNVATSTMVRYSYPVSGAYQVTLRIYNTSGCYRETTQLLSVGSGYSIMVPNVFTPNNDGINDFFRPLTTGLSKINFSIHDQYGNLIYFENAEEKDLNQLNGLEINGWNGEFDGGVPPYFIYTIDGLLHDGTTTVEKTGTFILLK